MRTIRPLLLVAATAAIAFCAVAAPTAADVSLPAVFGDHMVLQRGEPIVVWGWADPGEEVVVTLAGSADLGRVPRAKAVADGKGKWRARLRAVAAPKGMTGLELRVEGRNTITLTDVALGEVWLCSGQSNMTWPVSKSANAAEEMAAANHPQIRMFTVSMSAAREPQDDLCGRWTPASPEAMNGWGYSAVAYYFGRELKRELDVPIGLLHASWPASSVFPWTSAEGLAASPEVAAFRDRAATQSADKLDAYEQEFGPRWKQWFAEARAARAAGKPAPACPNVSFKNAVRRAPSAIYNAMIAPLTDYPVRGVIWYQGENDVHHGMFYSKLFAAHIADWRRQWGRPELPFLFVQLAGYNDRGNDANVASQVAELREAQAATLSVPHTAMAVAIDLGEPKNIHPANKQDVGRRLALGALALAYDKDVVYRGPTLKSARFDGPRAVLTFDHVGGGLQVRGDALKGFAVAGPDGVYQWAKAKVTGKDTVVVQAEGVARAKAVRYGWANYIECNLYGGTGLPAVPMRTDAP